MVKKERSNEEKAKLFLENKESVIYTNNKDQCECDFVVYREETADGYEIFVAKHQNVEHIYPMEHIHYYDHELCDIIIEHVNEGESVYVDEDIYDDIYLEDKLADEYDDFIDDIKDNMVNYSRH